MNLETLLREATHTHAGDVGPQLRRVNDLAAVARWRARRRHTRRLLAGAATVVAVVASGAIAVPQLMGPAREAPLVLTPASYTLPEFPYTPGWVPDGVAEPNVQLWGEVPDMADWEVVVEHEATEEKPHSAPLIQVRIISPGEPDDRSGGLPMEDIVVRDTPGVLTSDGQWLSVTWADPAGRLVQVGASEREVGREGLLRYVEELVEKPLLVTPPVTLATVPVGTEVNTVQPSYVSLDLPGGRQLTLVVHDQAKVDQLRADLRSSPDYVLPPPVGVEVAGRPAELVDIGEGKLALSISFEPDLMLTISPWSHGQETLLAFAEGADLTRYARPASFT